MINDLSGKRAIVTGGTGGIGLAIAAGLAKAGARVVITGREQGRVDAALGRLREATGRDDVAGVVADVGAARGCEALIAAEPQADILVKNLGIYRAREFFEIADTIWNAFFEVNFLRGDTIGGSSCGGRGG